MVTKKTANATIIDAKVRVFIDIKDMILEQLYLKLPDAADIVIGDVDWDDTYDFMDGDLQSVPITVTAMVAE